jgi:hypothetical protein
MSNYTQTTNFTAKDSLPSGTLAKRIRGSEFDVEFSAIVAAVSSKADTTYVDTEVGTKQDELVSGTNIKTVNGSSLLGSGNVAVGDVVGPTSSTDNTLPRFDGTTGKLLQGSGVAVDDSNNVTGVASINGGQLAGMRNKIINGKMEIAQRGTSFAAASGYTLDRWQIDASSSAVLTASQQNDVPSSNEFQNSLRTAVTTADSSIAAGEFARFQYKLEGYNVREFIGKTFTLSFWVRSSKTGIHCVGMRNSGADRSYVGEYTINAANTWEQKSITVTGGFPSTGTWDWTNGVGIGLNFMLACGSTFQTTAGAWQTGNFLGSANQVNCLDTIGNIFAITGVQLEVGSVATPFEHRPFGAELALCQRYYETGSVGDPVGVSYGLAAGSNYKVKDVSFAETKRATPTIVLSSLTYVQSSGAASNSVDTKGFTVSINSTFNNSHIRLDTGVYTASAEL